MTPPLRQSHPLSTAEPRTLCGRTFLVSETRTSSGRISAIWQALPGTAIGRPTRFRPTLFQPASEACLSILSERQPYTSDAIAALERRARLRPEEIGWLARQLAEAFITPRIPNVMQISATLERLFLRAAVTDQTVIRQLVETAQSSPDPAVRQRARQFLRIFPPRSERPR